ncbi:MAG: PQQ-binding-like beta-propeller repeat protein [Deltaproteobacteria bacterium]|nr:PQQ-binding-like beta-propeller repeat protein [Deltaproteobacteria bacterium]
MVFKSLRFLRLFGELLLLIFSLCACPAREKIAIEKIVPTRMGAGIKLTRPATVESISIRCGKRLVSQQKVDERVNTFLVDFNWEEGKSYTFNVKTHGGMLSRESSPFEVPRPFELGEDRLGSPCEEVEAAKIDEWSKKLYEEVDVSARKKIGVGSFDQTVRVYDQKGRLLWKHKIPTGVVRCVKFSPTGDFLFAGEASPDGNIYSFWAATGKLCWKYATAKDLGTSKTTYYGHQPKVCSIAIVGKRVYVGATMTTEDYLADGNRKVKYWPKKGILYAFEVKTGKLLWRFPATGLLDTAPLRVSVDANGQYLVFGGWGGSANGRVRQRYPENTLYLLNAANGQLLWSYFVPPAGKYGFGSASIGSGCNISPNGKYVACCSMDGRLFLFDIRGCAEKKIPRLIYEKAVSMPLSVSGIPIYAYGGKVFVDDEGGVLLTIGRTYIAPAGKGLAKAPDVKHPRENSLIKLDRDGTISWIWPARGPIETPCLSRDGRYLVVSMCHNYITRSKDMAGIYCFDLKQPGGGSKKFLWFYRMKGLGIACGISPDGKYIGAIEGPVDIDPRDEYQRIVGEHRVYILS